MKCHINAEKCYQIFGHITFMTFSFPLKNSCQKINQFLKHLYTNLWLYNNIDVKCLLYN